MTAGLTHFTVKLVTVMQKWLFLQLQYIQGWLI